MRWYMSTLSTLKSWVGMSSRAKYTTRLSTFRGKADMERDRHDWSSASGPWVDIGNLRGQGRWNVADDARYIV